MLVIILFRFVRLLGSGHQAIAVENLALRLQLAAFKRKRKRPVLTQCDRLFWVGMSRLWREALVFVQPDTVVRWPRERFRNSGPDYLSRSVVAKGDPLSPSRFNSLSCEWLRPILSGARRESTAN